MTVALNKDARSGAVTSIERYFQDELDEKIGNIRAAALLNFFLEEIGPSVYNRGVADAQERLQMRVTELDIECHEDEFGYWKQGRFRVLPRHARAVSVDLFPRIYQGGSVHSGPPCCRPRVQPGPYGGTGDARF